MNKYFKNILDSHEELLYEDKGWVDSVGYVTRIINKNTGNTVYTTVNLNMVNKDNKLEFKEILDSILKEQDDYE